MTFFHDLWDVLKGNDNPDTAVEITLKDATWKEMKEIALRLQPNADSYGKSLFITTKDQLRQFLLLRLHRNIYVSVNPRRKIWAVSKQGKPYQTWRGTNVAVAEMRNIFVDIDAIREDDARVIATPAELQRALAVACDVRKKMEEEFGNIRYLLVCTGNGYQLFFTLPQPITWQPLPYTRNGDEILYTETEEFDMVKHIGAWAVAPLLSGVEKGRAKIDKTWDLRRVGRLPYTPNMKGVSIPDRYAEIIEGVTRGAAYVPDTAINDKLMRIARNAVQAKLEGRKVTPRQALAQLQYKSIKQLLDEPLVQLLLSGPLPSGYRNHYLEMQLAILLRDNVENIPPTEIAGLLREISRIQGRQFAAHSSYLPKNATFSPDVVNRWCALERRPPVYKPRAPLDEAKLKQWDAADIGSATLERAVRLGFAAEPTLETEKIIERMRDKRPAARLNAVVYATWVRAICTDDDWPYWRDHWLRTEWAS